MAYPVKIATCCYCGTRAALVLRGKDRHELACSTCGAPLHELKKLPVDRQGERELVDRPSPAYAKVKSKSKSRPKPSKKRKRRTGLLKEMFEEAFDFLEDIFD